MFIKVKNLIKIYKTPPPKKKTQRRDIHRKFFYYLYEEGITPSNNRYKEFEIRGLKKNFGGVRTVKKVNF